MFRCVVIQIELMLAYSSEIYEIEPKDIAALPDAKQQEQIPVDDKIVIKVGNNVEYKQRQGSRDVLLRGRKEVAEAVKKHKKYIRVRVLFEPKNKKFDFISPMIRIFRYRLRTYSSNYYHVSPKFIREKGLERNIRNIENAYIFSNAKHKMSDKDRHAAYKKLYRSMEKKGFDDRHPLDIMLCRNMGVKDTLNQGHHRMAVAMDLGLKRVSVIFSSAGAAPRWLHGFFLLIAKMNMFFKR